MHTTEHYPKVLDATEVIVTDHSGSEPSAMSHPKAGVITKELTSAELQHRYQLEPEDNDKEFLCGEK
eukprot:8723972-Pyramimonas_sp.AAC.1